jgi:hypothetical protein
MLYLQSCQFFLISQKPNQYQGLSTISQQRIGSVTGDNYTFGEERQWSKNVSGKGLSSDDPNRTKRMGQTDS